MWFSLLIPLLTLFHGFECKQKSMIVSIDMNMDVPTYLVKIYERAFKQGVLIYLCAGSLIHPKFVLTSGLCVQNIPLYRIRITANLKNKNDTGITQSVVGNYYSEKEYLSLLQIESVFTLPEINTIHFSTEKSDDKGLSEGFYYVVRWDHESTLRREILQMWPLNTCYWNFMTYGPDYVCGKYEPSKESGTCITQHGAPLIHKHKIYGVNYTKL